MRSLFKPVVYPGKSLSDDFNLLLESVVKLLAGIQLSLMATMLPQLQKLSMKPKLHKDGFHFFTDHKR